jgi:hypothetical protein
MPKRKGRAPKPAPSPQCTPLHAARTSSHALHQPAPADGGGDNFRVVVLDDACVGMAFLGPRSALLVECPWENVLRTFPAPLFRHRYGM